MYKPVGQLSINDDAYPQRKADILYSFRATSALDRGFKKSKKGRKLSIHCNGDSTNAELLFRTIISVNQPSVHGAIGDWCGEMSQQVSDHAFSSTRNLAAQMNVVYVITKPLEIDVLAQ